MKIPDAVRKTVGFVGYENKTTGETVPVGSFFFLGHDPEDGQVVSPKMYAVTARHVIDELRKRGVEGIRLRLNAKSEAAAIVEVLVPINHWFTHPSNKSIDVAIVEMGIPPEADHLVIAFQMTATKKVFTEHEVELGDEVFISGLFRHHYGRRRNIPIVRVGSLAALNEEKIVTKTYGEIDGYLIEARSIGGLSGSPVFLNLGIIRHIGGQVKQTTGQGPIIYLLGLIHGHFDVKADLVKASDDASPDATNEAVNAGIAIVVPVESILEVIEAYEAGPKD